MTTPAPRQGDAPRRVLVFCRPYLVPDFRENVAPLAAEFDFHFLTDGHSPGTPDTRADFYANLRANHRCSELSTADEADVTARCRLMRNIDPAQARQMAHAMAGALVKALDAARPAIVLSHMVDDYVTHLLSKLAEKRHILFAGYAYSYFPGLIQLTAFSNGTALRLREPGDDEVDTVVQTISQRVYRQNYLQRDNYTLARHVKGILRYSVKRVVFALKARLESDPWHLHYAVTPFLVERRRLRDFPGRGEFHADWAATLAAARQAKPGAVVYLPLGYFPESTIDYWITNTRILRYEDTLLGFVRALARDHVVVVKEHLHMMGARDCRLYRALMAIPNVVSVHTDGVQQRCARRLRRGGARRRQRRRRGDVARQADLQLLRHQLLVSSRPRGVARPRRRRRLGWRDPARHRARASAGRRGQAGLHPRVPAQHGTTALSGPPLAAHPARRPAPPVGDRPARVAHAARRTSHHLPRHHRMNPTITKFFEVRPGFDTLRYLVSYGLLTLLARRARARPHRMFVQVASNVDRHGLTEGFFEKGVTEPLADLDPKRLREVCAPRLMSLANDCER